MLTSSDSERIDSAQFSRNSYSRDVSRITASTLPLATKYPKLPEPPNPPSVLIGEIHSEDTPQNEPGTTRLRPRRPPILSLLKITLKGEPKRRVKLSNSRGDTGKISNNIEPIRGNLNERIYILLSIW